MNGALHCRMIGGFGNNLFQYAFCRAYAERHGLELFTDDWVGRKIFDLKESTNPPKGLTGRQEGHFEEGEQNISLCGYFQRQEALIYTRKQVRVWFTFARHIVEWVEKHIIGKGPYIVCHRRVDDYSGYGYPIVGQKSYFKAMKDFGLHSDFIFVRKELPWIDSHFPKDVSFLPDFLKMVYAPVLLRANSSFSWWAGTLGDSAVFSPVIDGLKGCMEHDNVPFVEGNWPRLADLDFITDLHLKEE